MAKRQIITLLTDFSTRDPYVAAMKGVILRMSPQAKLVDISHEIPAHDVMAAAVVLAQAAPYFPAGTVHVVVVDPGVGTERCILVGEFGDQLFVFPDNGVITFIADVLPLKTLVAVRNTEYLPAQPGAVSATFHGRDIFAPVAGHILNGAKLSRLGPQPETYKLLDVPEVADEGEALAGEVIYVDAFGNLIANIPRASVQGKWEDLERLEVFCGDQAAGGLQAAYGFVGAGEPLALFNSMGLLEVAVNQGRACDFFSAGVGARIQVRQA